MSTAPSTIADVERRGRDTANASSFRPALALAALGVVFGDIGTSPLYTLKTCFTTAKVEPTLENVLGIISLLFWTLVIVVCIKYVGTLMRVDHDGEGGILALLALSSPDKAITVPVKVSALSIIVIAGASMLFGDGIITPAISVISAVEGLDVATTAAHQYIVPIAVAILLVLFLVQSRGTEKLGKMFGPVMVLWFVAIAIAGLIAILQAPQILAAFDPRHAVYFSTHHGIYGFLVFGAIVLAITGVEALYADMSHFGPAPISVAWYVLVFPALILNYFGQGANLLVNKHAFDNPFYSLTSGPWVIPMVALATAATVIASQALISGAFTLTEQAVNLNLWPRLGIVHTSSQQSGQVYVPLVNTVLAIACIALVVTFRSSDHLAAAYGLAVSATMLATTMAFYHVVTKVLHWKAYVVLPLTTLFLIVDSIFVLSGLPKIVDGAWLPLAISAVFVLTSWTWLVGRRAVSQALFSDQLPIEQYLREAHPSETAPTGTMVFLTGNPTGVPFIGGRHRWIRARADEESIVIMTLQRAARPYVPQDERVTIDRINDRFHIVHARFGYMESPSIDKITVSCDSHNLHLDTDDTSYFYADPKLVAAKEKPIPNWQRKFFAILIRNSRPIPDDMGIRAERRVELGVEVAI